MERITRRRAIALFLLFAMILGLLGFRMYDLQVLDGSLQDSNQSTYSTWTRVVAARGEILDRNGNVLVTNRASFNLVFNNYVFYNSESPNESLRRLVNLLYSSGIDYIEHFPVTLEKPYEYTLDELDSTWTRYFRNYLNYRDLDSDISAAQLMKQLRSAYRIPNDWTDLEVRMAVGLRYEMELRSDLTNLPAYVLVEDVSDEELTAILELNIPGLTVEISTVREYTTQYAAHILGYLGLMNGQEYEVYKEQGYSMDAYIGRTGFEAAFEEHLHGTDGVKITEMDAEGNIVAEYFTREPRAGSNVETTIDIDMQAAGEDALEQVILDARENGVGSKGEGKDAEGGAVVAIDVKTGEVLVCASYPTFDLSTIWEDWNDLLEEDYGPLNNRALDLTYAPGSVFKMAVTIAGVNAHTISSGEIIEDMGIYTRYEGYQPQCLIYSNSGGTRTHGRINVIEALAVSCNYYFYETGIRTGMEAIDAVSRALGLGEQTGVELPEESGRRANDETKKALYPNDPDQSGWYSADTLQLSIGQSENKFTPMQLAVYTAALANRGIRYKATFLSRVVSSDYQELIVEAEPKVLSTCEISDDAYYSYTRGMRMAVTDSIGTVYAYLRDYPVAVAAKTGTAQHGGAGSDNASFVCYAPYDDPQIAIAVFVEKGAQGGNLANVARAIMDVYFNQAQQSNTDIPTENVGN